MSDIKYKLKLFFMKLKLRNLRKDLNKVELHLYFDGWTGANCIEETNYLCIEIKEQQLKISNFEIKG